MFILIDNYDSFTHIIELYFKELDVEIKLFKNDEITNYSIQKLSPKAIVLSPGPGSPEVSGNSFSILTWAIKNHIPVLGVCLGHQIIGQFFGAKINYAQEVFHGKVSHIQHNSKGLFLDIKNQIKVARYHSLVILKDNLRRKSNGFFRPI